MRTFEAAQVAHDLYQWGNGRIGTLHLPRSKQAPRLLFRRIDDASVLNAYVEIFEAARAWVNVRSELSSFVRFQPIAEVGVDFIARPYWPAGNTLQRFEQQAQDDWDGSHLPPPAELTTMRDCLKALLVTDIEAGREAVVCSVVEASLMRGSDKTVSSLDGWFQVLEPSIAPQHVEQWLDTSQATGERSWSPVVAESSGRGKLDGLPLYYRQPGREYFEAELADRWQENWWGLPEPAAQYIGLLERSDPLALFRVDTATTELRDLVVGYLESAVEVVAGQAPMERCDHCDELLHLASYRSDGRWLWASDLGHQVRHHGYFVPNRMLDHIRASGSPPSQISVPVEKLPWPKS